MDEEKKEGEEYKEPVENRNPVENNPTKPKEEGYVAPQEPIKEPVNEPVKEPINQPFETKQSLTDKFRKNPFILSTIVFGILALILLIGMSSGGITGNVVSGEEAGNNVVGFLNTVADSEVNLVDVETQGDFYKVTIGFKGDELPVYVTRDGEYYTSALIPLVLKEQDVEEAAPSGEVSKSDKPKVELFVMTHCPYGTQAEKGILSVFELLGDNIDAKIRFVHYFMHDPEEAETPRQVCIREEQSEKYLDYLQCFLEDGDADRCLTEANINQDELSDCIDNRAEGYYAEDSDLSEGYGVRGSPTLVINGNIVSSARSSAAYLDAICQSFNNVLGECGNVLSSTPSSPGFGWAGTGSASSSSCG